MSKTISIGLSVTSIERGIQELKQYQQELNKKCERFVRALMAEGISVAKTAVSGSEYGSYLSFTAEYKSLAKGFQGIMYVTNTGIIHSEWLQKDGSTKTADVSPLLMAEFGAGSLARNPKNIPGVGQGTFPGQTHALEPGWWYATGTRENPIWHYSSGHAPEQPVYKASLRMYQAISETAKRIFT